MKGIQTFVKRHPVITTLATLAAIGFFLGKETSGNDDAYLAIEAVSSAQTCIEQQPIRMNFVGYPASTAAQRIIASTPSCMDQLNQHVAPTRMSAEQATYCKLAAAGKVAITNGARDDGVYLGSLRICTYDVPVPQLEGELGYNATTASEKL